jgi:hypothetical protein
MQYPRALNPSGAFLSRQSAAYTAAAVASHFEEQTLRFARVLSRTPAAR